MPDVVTFDPVARRIVEIDTGADNEIDAVEVYSEWKDWILADSSRLKHPPAFTIIGGQPLDAGLTRFAPTYIFLINRWRFRPAEHTHRVRIVGNLYTDDGDPINVPTIGTYNVNVETEVSPQAITVNAGFTAAQVAQLQEIWKRLSLDPADPFTTTPSEMRTASGDIVIDVSGDGVSTATGSRQ